MKTGTIYGLICPIAQKIVYVGQTTLSIKIKLALSKSHAGASTYGEWITKLTTEGLLDELQIVILESNVSIEIITVREKWWINFCNNQHPLINKNFNPRDTKRGKIGAHALFRFFVLDREFMSGTSTLENLIDAVNEIFPDIKFSKRTVQLDIEEMRHNTELGINAPIEYSKQSRTYFYSNPDYSLLELIEQRFYSKDKFQQAA